MTHDLRNATPRQLHDRLGAMIDQIGHPDYSLRELVDGLREIRDELFTLSASEATTPARGLSSTVKWGDIQAAHSASAPSATAPSKRYAERERETPRTDAEERFGILHGADGSQLRPTEGGWVTARYARQLERELAEAKADAEEYRTVARQADQAAREMHAKVTASANTALSDVAAERRRQIEKEGWSSEHDDEHTPGCLAVAGACYALYAASRVSTEAQSWRDRYAGAAYELWPWDEEWRKPKDTRRDLIRAAALIVAEIERLDRQIHAADRQTATR